MIRPSTIGSVLALLLLPGAAAAQRLRGRTLEQGTRLPVAGATVVLEAAGGRAVARTETDSAGVFSFVARPGRYSISTARFGYEDARSDLVTIGAHGVATIDLLLDPDPVAVAPVGVAARRGALAGFEERRRRGRGGIFFTREDIERRKPQHVSDLFWSIHGLELFRNEMTGPPHVRRSDARSSSPCPTLLFVDGYPGMGTVLDDLPPHAIAGIEVYLHASDIPPEYNSLAGGAACGVVLIWTRDR